MGPQARLAFHLGRHKSPRRTHRRRPTSFSHGHLHLWVRGGVKTSPRSLRVKMDVIDLNTDEGREQLAWLFAGKTPPNKRQHPVGKKKRRKATKPSRPASPTEQQIQQTMKLAAERGKINMDAIRAKLRCSWEMSALIKQELVSRGLIGPVV